jgi:hypothetical protein
MLAACRAGEAQVSTTESNAATNRLPAQRVSPEF